MKPDIYEIIGDLLDTNKPSCLERYNKVKDYINSLEQYIEVLNHHISFYKSTDKALAYFRFNNGNPRYNRANLTPEEEQIAEEYLNE